MEAVVHAVRVFVEWLLWPLDALHPTLALTIVAVLTALLMLVVVKRTSPQRLTQRTRDGMAAAVFEMRLFLDEPGRVVRAQGRLLGNMALYLGTLLPSFAVLGPPLALLYLHLEVRHGLAPLGAPAEIVLRVELERGVDGHAVEVTCDDDAVEVTAPVLFAEDEPAAYVRLAVREAGTHVVTVHAGAARATKRIVADPNAAAVAPERTGGLALLWSFGDEPPPDGGITSISLTHPPRPQRWLGLGIPWWLYWLGIATVIALLLRRRFDVVF